MKVTIELLLALCFSMIIVGCGGGGSDGELTTPTPSFDYKTQSEVTVNVTVTNDLNVSLAKVQRQILIFQTKTYNDNTKIDELNGLLTSGVIKDGHFSETFTLGQHLSSLWVIVPALQYENNITIPNNHIIEVTIDMEAK